ncbi:cold shock and DUF1294 domain-containing protein [Nodularia harveyana UHCC-0300]|uniref:Cold shock and DUF1294 domain-containing protein n=1 Tax=Nodularia harveyana UHCC-0300 TaxID=2974287 RepID=A0ABU5UKD8_9CYAN|nr:cold shock and DUF1294 domain-containing protein [Nodularia harveyana]MEA5583545.1 cold shock and DUF1294 domain-containing protein [Nodularia harveyana UHCC-0300]
MKPVRHKGQLIKWKDDRGFGFIESSEGSQEVFIHISAFRNLNRRPQVGDIICYQLAVEQNGKLRGCNASIEGMIISKPVSQSLPSQRPKKLKSPPLVKSSSLGLEVLLLSLIPSLGSIHFLRTTGIPLPLFLYPGMSLITFALYADDKSRAKKGIWRVPEKTLHLCEFFGGWLGGFIAQRKLHHKSSKAAYQVEFWTIVILHLVFWVVWLLAHPTLIKMIFLEK